MKSNPTTQKEHKHEWKEDPMFASGVFIMIAGGPNDLGEETRVVCECGAVDYVRIKDLGSLMDIYKQTEDTKPNE